MTAEWNQLFAKNERKLLSFELKGEVFVLPATGIFLKYA
jgi:hypothetical protein